jgi:hypothetical protein
MTHHWDDFSKSLAEGSSTRRESLRLLGAALAGAVLSPLAMRTARGAGKPRAADPCKTICRCSKKMQQDACLKACRSCTGATSRLCGSCGTGVNCYDLAHDVRNCGACGNTCLPGPYEQAACVSGRCVYSCVEGALNCYGRCIPVLSDPNNCGACGNVCGGSMPYCSQGQCTDCAGVDFMWDSNNCGACGVVCPPQFACAAGVCEGI